MYFVPERKTTKQKKPAQRTKLKEQSTRRLEIEILKEI